MTEIPARLQSGHLLAHFEIERLLGRGGMGEVYLAHDENLKRRVAIKILPEGFASDKIRLARFRREATSAAALNHPNICTIHEVGEAEGLTYICMEYVEGRTLSDCLREKALSIEEIYDIGLQIAGALEQARQKGIVHRDIKSQNMILMPEGQVKILDFGLAKNLPPQGEARELPDVTMSLTPGEVSFIGVVMGTASYMSPEQALGLEVDHRSDLFSFGVVLYEMMTRRTPFAGQTAQEVLPKIVYDSAPPIVSINKDAPAGLVRIVDKLLAKKREERFQTARDVKDALVSARAGSAALPAVATGSRLLLRRFLWPAIGVSAAFILFFFLIIGPGGKGIVPSAETASVAALPSQVYGAAEFKYLTDAIPSTLSTYLGQIEGLEIKAPPTSFEVEKVHGDLRKIADAYGVKALVKTSVTAETTRFVLSVQLIEAKSLRQVWGKTYEGADYLDLLQKSAEGVRQWIKPDSSRALAVPEKRGGSPAELAFRRGQYYSNCYNNLFEPSDFEEAFTAFKKVLELDQKMADAAAEIAMLFVFKIESGAPPQDAVPEIESWSRRALQINERCSKGWNAMASVEMYKPRSNMKKFLEFGLKAAFYGPEDAIAQNNLGIVFAISGPFYLSLSTFIESGRLDPLYTISFLNAAQTLLYSGRNEEVLSNIEKSLSLEPESPPSLFNKALYFVYLGRLQESTELMNKIEKAVVENKLPRSYFIQLSQLQSLQTGEGKSAEKALAEALKIVESPEISSNDLSFYAMDFPPILIRQGKKEAALRILEKGVDAQTVAYDYLRLNPDLQKLKGEPRFEKILIRAKSQFDEILTIINQARARGEFPKYLEKPLADLLDKLGMKGDRKQFPANHQEGISP